MRVEREELNPCTVLLKVACSPDQVQAGVRKAIKTLAKRIKVQGFRPGTAPIAVLEQMIPAEEIDAMAQEETVNATFKAAAQGEGLEIGGQAQIEAVTFDRAKELCEYTVKVPLAPKVTLGDYKGLEADRYKVSVAEAEVDRQVDELRGRSGKKKPVERGVREGDNALVNIKVEGVEGDGRNFMLVAGQTFPDLDAALLGMKQDDIKSVEIQFPEGFQEADLAGKSHKCTLTVRSVSAVELPDADDEFAKSMNVESLDELKVSTSCAPSRAWPRTWSTNASSTSSWPGARSTSPTPPGRASPPRGSRRSKASSSSRAPRSSSTPSRTAWTRLPSSRHKARRPRPRSSAPCLSRRFSRPRA